MSCRSNSSCIFAQIGIWMCKCVAKLTEFFRITPKTCYDQQIVDMAAVSILKCFSSVACPF